MTGEERSSCVASPRARRKWLERYIGDALAVDPDVPILVDRFLEGAVEVDVDCLADRFQNSLPLPYAHVGIFPKDVSFVCASVVRLSSSIGDAGDVT